MYRQMFITVSDRYPIIAPIISKTLNMITNQMFISIPSPPKDHAREKIAKMTMATVQTMIRMKRPYSTVLIR